MKVSILGKGLTSLTLAKSLINHGIYVDIFFKPESLNKNKMRTLAISEGNIEFFNKNILNIEKLLWNINRIEIFSENLKNEKILNFKNNGKNLFSIIKNQDLSNFLLKELKSSKLVKFKKSFPKDNILISKYNLVFNCDIRNKISQKYFYKRIIKDYKSFAHTTIIEHKNISDNNSASQIFTKNGPLAFLPISEKKTSIVYSARGKKNINFKNLIEKYNFKYTIKKINDIHSFELKSSNLRSYYYKNVLAFGDLLHKLHPLAGQGFNMSIRDISQILKFIKFRINHGLDLDSSICSDFEKEVKHKNYLFSSGIDFIYEFFNLESRTNNNFLSKSVQLIGKYKFTNKIFTKLADNGISI
tara:strand:- start:1534 stop:2607 length:1074 start_codon:yes stop_codon:yes gene_type:complete